MDAAQMVSLTDYCIEHDIAPEAMQAAFYTAMRSGAMVLRSIGEWIVITDEDERMSFAAYVATLHTKEGTPDV